MSKFLVMWNLDLGRVGPDAVKAVLSMPSYAERMKKQNKLVHRYHLVGKHGGAWIYNADSNEDLERCLVQSPVYNLANFDVYPLAEMPEPPAQDA